MKIRFEPFGISGHVNQGVTVLQAAIELGVKVEGLCAGRGTCGKCRVIASEGLSTPTAMELKNLTEEELRKGYRLACQAAILSDAVVTVPEESRIAQVNILAEGIAQGSLSMEPWVRRYVLHVPAATLENQVADLQNVMQVWHEHHDGEPTFTLSALRQLPFALRERDGHIALVLANDQVVYVAAGDGPEHILGIAFDIGTTTVVGYLMDLESGERLAVSSLLNPQTKYGADVVSRILFATEKDSGLQILQREIIGALNQIIAQTIRTANVAPENIYGVTVVGNTTMYHLFLGISPAALGRMPYVPAVSAPLCLLAKDLGIAIHPDAHVWVLPNIAGWVGADTVGVILATDLPNHEDIALAIDIGTNGEMVMGSRRRLIACSTAAGPAFEGAHLSCGMRAADGAIDAISIDGDVRWHTIGESAPRGICGSGLVDLIAEMLRVGIIDSTGMMQDGQTLRANGRSHLAERILQNGTQREFLLVSPAESAGGRPIKVTQRDVRELQLAKGAIRAGVQILMKELGIGPEDVKRVYLAGAFGNYIRPESALAIGLMPRFPNAKIIPVGNAAGAGARMALLSLSARKRAAQIPAQVEYLELSGRPDFQEEFVTAMLFS